MVVIAVRRNLQSGQERQRTAHHIMGVTNKTQPIKLIFHLL